MVTMRDLGIDFGTPTEISMIAVDGWVTPRMVSPPLDEVIDQKGTLGLNFTNIKNIL